MLESIQLSVVLPTNSQEAYLAWLDSKEHSEFTGGLADIDPDVGGKFSVWDGYVEGENLELEPYKKIVQSWRATDFPSDSPDSRLEILFEDTKDGLLLTLNHTEIPEGQSKEYEDGWIKFYFEPMNDYFK